MAKTFKELREETKEANRKTWEKHKQEMREIKEKKATPNQVEVAPVKRNRIFETFAVGFAWWLAIPAIMVILIVGIFLVVGTWDWIVGLFN